MPASMNYSDPDITNYYYRFTAHEHLDDFCLINMNGRMYDPVLAMFLSPDPFIQSPETTQNFNRYAYVLNNPLKYTDPTGYSYDPIGDEWTDVYWYDPYPYDVPAQERSYRYTMTWYGVMFWGTKSAWNSAHGILPGGPTSADFNYWFENVGGPDSFMNWYNHGGRNGIDLEITDWYFVENGFQYLYTTYKPKSNRDKNKEPILKFVGFNNGIPEFESRLMPSGTAVTPGPFIIYSTGNSKEPYYNTHEPGHVIQFYILGPVNYIKYVGIPSLISAKYFPNQHNQMPWERSANQLWYWLTNERHKENPLLINKK
jgi:RHS repeat-associated protein